jgi:hypothetical protein
VSVTGDVATLVSTGTIAVAGTVDTDAGTLDGTIGGARVSGALRQRETWGSGLAISGPGTAFFASGTLRYTLSGKFLAPALVFTGSIKVTGGSGRYAEASGTLPVTGSATVTAGTKLTLSITGKLRY